MLATATLAGCGNSSSPAGHEAITTSSTMTPTRCRAVPVAVRERIGFALDRGVRLGIAAMVRSRDYRHVWMVSGELTGAAFNGEVATWATNRLGRFGTLFSAEALAEEFSGMARIPGGSIDDDGIAESQDCAQHGF